MYNLTQDVITGINIVAALQEERGMPSVAEVERELDYLAQYVAESEKFYGVAFKRSTDKDNVTPDDCFDVISDTKAHFEEFYFGGSQELEFGYRPRPLFRLVMEPLLDSMATLSHDDILDFTGNVVEQLKEHLVMADFNKKLDSTVAYKLYRKMTLDRIQDKKIKEATSGVMKLRRKTLALQADLRRSRGK